MRSKLGIPSALLASSLLLSPLAVSAAATGPVQHATTTSTSSPSSAWSAFPGLRWLRDSAVELIFGPPKDRDAVATATWADVHKLYNDYVVVRFNVTNREEEEKLRETVEKWFLDVWAVKKGEYVDIGMLESKLPRMRKGPWLPGSLHSPEFVVTDVVDRVWATYPHGKRYGEGRIGGRERGGIEEWEERIARDVVGRRVDDVDNMFFRDYQPLSVITNWLKLLEAMFPSHTELLTIGTSYEGRPILGLRLGVRDQNDSTTEPRSSSGDKRKTILITGGIHAREWISTSSVNYLVWSLTTAYGKETLVTKLLEQFDVVLVPVVNPDGYAYTWSTDRLWRKSRQETTWDQCPGMDLDHAFGYEWDGAAKSLNNPCSETYGGDKPWQAVEAAELADWATNETQSNGVKFVGLLDLHSYSQQILYPYSYSCSVDPPNLENLEELGVGLAKAIRLSSGEVYDVESACEGAVGGDYSAGEAVPRVEAGGGSFMDWFYHEMGAHFSYQVKLRDTGSYGFLLPTEDIVPTGEEMYAAVRYFADYLLGNNGREKVLATDTGSERPVEKENETVQTPVEEPVMPERPLAADSEKPQLVIESQDTDSTRGEGWTELRRRGGSRTDA
ncbi:hypothetical protein GE09DRAFT_599020 [Coniochaeta sp. 2T2.1]|nr:hypothetical protein GE09DRAFT_599020 [Coniochaeta sp. 2T2.1]